MVVRKRVGQGAVYFFAFPGEAFEQWEDRGPFLAAALRGHERLAPFSQSELMEKGPEMLDEVAGAEVAPRSFMMVALGTFFVVAAVALGLARWRGRDEIAWAVIIPAGLLIGGVSYQTGMSYRQKVGTSLNEIAVVAAGSGSSTGLRHAMLGLHSEGDLNGELVAEHWGTVFAPARRAVQQEGKISALFFDVSPPMRQVQMHLTGGSFGRYQASSLVELGGEVIARFKPGPEGLSGTISNNTPIELRNCLCVVNSYPFVVGRLAPGESTRLNLTEGNFKAKQDFTTEAVLGSGSRTRKAIITHLFTLGRQQAFAPWAQRLFLLGWADRDFIAEHLEGTGEEGVSHRSIALVTVEAEVERPDAGTEVLIPRTFALAALRPGRRGIALPLSSAMKEQMPLASQLVLFLPEWAENLQIQQAELHLAATGRNLRVNLRGKDEATGDVSQLAEWENPDGRRDVSIPDPARFHDRTRNALTFRLIADPIAEVEAESASFQWTLSDASVTVRGIAQ
jgi:hypothetical protein